MIFLKTIYSTCVACSVNETQTTSTGMFNIMHIIYNVFYIEVIHSPQIASWCLCSANSRIMDVCFVVCCRYIYVCHAPVARTWCTMPRVLKCIAWISFMATLHQSTRFVDRDYLPVNISWGDQENVTVCKVSRWDGLILSYSNPIN